MFMAKSQPQEGRSTELRIPKGTTKGDLEGVLSRLVEAGIVSAQQVHAQLGQIRKTMHERLEAVAVVEEKQLSPERVEVWLGEFKTRFYSLEALHKGIEWSDVEKSLRADPEAIREFQELDAHGHRMNVFGEKNGEYIIASAWNDYKEVSADHRNITYDLEAQKLVENNSNKRIGNAVSILAKIKGIKEDEADLYLADPSLHEQLRKVVRLDGWAWLKIDVASRKQGLAPAGFKDGVGVGRVRVREHDATGSFRAERKVKKVA